MRQAFFVKHFRFRTYAVPLHLFTFKTLQRTLFNKAFILKATAGSYAILDTVASLMLVGKAHVHF